MRYVKQFVRTLSHNVEVKEDDKSSSVYCVIDDTFVVRLSDHLSPSDARTGINVNVVSIWRKPDFLVTYKNTLNPMVMNRKEVKAYIRVCHNNWLLEEITNKARGKWNEAMSAGAVDKYVYGMTNKYPTLTVYKDWKQLHTVLGSIKRFKPLSKPVRKVFELYFTEGKLNIEDILRLVFDKINASTKTEDAVDIIEKYLKDMPSKGVAGT